MKDTQISIITICYNNFLDLYKTYESLKNHLFNNIEWIVIDGSTNEEIYVFLQNISHDNIVYLFERDNGIYDAMNKGIDLANGRYLIFLNSGDTFTDINLIEISQILKFDIEVFNIRCVDRNNNQLKFRSFSLTPDELKLRPSVPHQSTFIKKNLLRKKYNTSYNYLSDYDMFCELYLEGANFNFHKDIYLSNFECEGVTSDFKSALKVGKEMKSIQKKHFNSFNFKIYLQNILKYFLFYFFRIHNLNTLRKK